jgi:large subunit ribosomal protein L18
MSKNKVKISRAILLRSTDKFRLSVKRSNTHIYAQIIDDKIGKTLVSANSLKLKNDSKLKDAELVGEALAKNAVKQKIKQIYLDRGKLRYTGRLKKLCESARSHGLEF